MLSERLRELCDRMARLRDRSSCGHASRTLERIDLEILQLLDRAVEHLEAIARSRDGNCIGSPVPEVCGFKLEPTQEALRTMKRLIHRQHPQISKLFGSLSLVASISLLSAIPSWAATQTERNLPSQQLQKAQTRSSSGKSAPVVTKPINKPQRDAKQS